MGRVLSFTALSLRTAARSADAETTTETDYDQLGRLLQVTRQMDMLMINEAAITQFKEDFMNGVYR